MKLFAYKRTSAMRLTAHALAYWLISNVLIVCQQGKATARTQETQVLYQSVQDPVAEMCTDDSESRTEYFDVPVVRFEESRIQLNGKTTSAEDLLTWAVRKYSNLPEQAVWVQFAPENKLTADRALLPMAKALPRLQIRRADFIFNCPKLLKK